MPLLHSRFIDRPGRMAGIAMLLGFALHPGLTHAAPVEVDVKVGQTVIQAEKPGRVYLRLSLKTVAALKKDRRTPVNVALVIDRSGSMQGDRIIAAQDAARTALDHLSADDTVSLVTFNHAVAVPHRASRVGTSQAAIKEQIDTIRADGTTAIYAGVEEGGRQASVFYAANKVNRVILLSDGLANVGPQSPQELAALGRRLASQGISVTTIGLGLQYNEDLMQQLAAASDGNHAFVERPEDLVAIFNKEFGDALSIAAQDIIITIECRNGFRPLRIMGREGTIEGTKISLRLAQLQENNERYVVVELDAPNGAAVGETDVAQVTVDYLDLSSNARGRADSGVKIRVSPSASEADASLDKSVMAHVVTQIATEENEKALALRDKNDIEGARKILKDNAATLKKSREVLSGGDAPAPAASLETLIDLEKKNSEAAEGLTEEAWGKTRKGMRSEQHKNKVQQAY